ncbi:NAD-dependent dehydratase [Sphingopyxis sp. MWB1]|uniref:NAD-dependent dehydratase n=1 Tax=Sphingopyxis sp. MWB1 TaxID=1537715 RepID=UPI000519F283|nr:NAD-dependent dehydratase [Sphingopyxis sp. MWB1]
MQDDGGTRPHSILLIGATGLVGRAVIAAVDRPLDILARRPLAGPGGADRPHVAPSADWPRIIAELAPDTLISCLGTTLRQAGSRAAFRAVDHDLLLASARAAYAAGARHMIAVSSVGASARSRNFYLRTKGEVEAALGAIGFDRLDILRPGLLTGARGGPRRWGEGLAMHAAPLTDALLRGRLRRYRSIPAERVARAIAALSRCTAPGVHVHENDAMRALAD